MTFQRDVKSVCGSCGYGPTPAQREPCFQRQINTVISIKTNKWQSSLLDSSQEMSRDVKRCQEMSRDVKRTRLAFSSWTIVRQWYNGLRVQQSCFVIFVRPVQMSFLIQLDGAGPVSYRACESWLILRCYMVILCVLAVSPRTVPSSTTFNSELPIAPRRWLLRLVDRSSASPAEVAIHMLHKQCKEIDKAESWWKLTTCQHVRALKTSKNKLHTTCSNLRQKLRREVSVTPLFANSWTLHATSSCWSLRK